MKILFIVFVLIIEIALIGSAVYLYVRFGENKKMISALVKKVETLDHENKVLMDARKRLEIDLKGQKTSGARVEEDKKQLENDLSQLQEYVRIIEGLKDGDVQGLRMRLKQLKINLADRFGVGEAPSVSAVQDTSASSENKRLLEEMFKELNGIYQNNSGGAYCRSRQFDKAIESYEKALKNNSRTAEAYYNLGLLYVYVKKDAVKAIEFYKRYLEYSPEAEDRDVVLGIISDLATFGVTEEPGGAKGVSLDSVSHNGR